MKGRDADARFRTLAARPIAEQVESASTQRYGAVYVDRRGYADRAKDVETVLARSLGPPIATSSDGDRAMYRLGTPSPPTISAAEQDALLGEGIAFAQRDLPPFVLGVEGISHAEPWGRWTDGAVAVIRFAHPLPPRFMLELHVSNVYGPNLGLPVRVRVGSEVREFTPTRPAETFRLEFAPGAPASTIELRIAKPASPLSLGASTDQRQLGIGLSRLRIVAQR
jgi:phosphoglycerol transferase